MQTQLALGDQFNNRGLFADHFLNDPQRNLLRGLPEWQQAAGLDDAFAAIQKLFRDKAARFGTNTNEAQTEHNFVKPVLNILWGEAKAGDCYQVQVSIPNLDARRQPDYAFFRKATERDAAEPRKGTIEYWRDVPCLGDAKKWTASLDKHRGADENPSGQIANYLYRSRVRWGILTNGRFWRLYEREKSSAGGVFYEVNLEDLLQRGDRESKQLYERHLAKGDSGSVLEFVEQQLGAKPERADVVHDLLAYLAERMIEMNKHKQAEVKGFLTWLERDIGAKIDDLSNKTKLNDYHEHDLETLLGVLQANRRKLGAGVSPAARQFQEAVEKEFTASLAKLTPLKARLAATDTLIDEIVYRLYGLTEEEIRIVNGESADAPTR